MVVSSDLDHRASRSAFVLNAWVALDFETANQWRDSPCAVGVVKVCGGRIVDAWSTLINPEAPFSWHNIAVHGITPEAVVDAPTFPAVLGRILATFDGAEALVAHNAAFDLQVLTDTATAYGMDLDPLPFACTRVFSRAWWPGWGSYGLVPVVHQLKLDHGLTGFRHHDAMSDAQACAAIALHGLAEQGVSSWTDAADAARVRLGEAAQDRLAGCIVRGSTRIVTTPPDADSLEKKHPLYGRNVCFTGALQLWTRRQAAQLITDVGAQFAPGVSRKVDLLIVGEQDLNRVGASGMSSKMWKAMELAANGHHIEVIDEPDLLQLIGDTDRHTANLLNRRRRFGWETDGSLTAAPPAEDYWPWRDKILQHDDGRASGGEPCVLCGVEVPASTHWKHRDRHVCGPRCNLNLNRRFNRALARSNPGMQLPSPDGDPDDRDS
jgi:DNA polymerase-3 subunit epsilon